MAMNQIQGMQWGAPGDREESSGWEDTYNMRLRSLQEMGPEAGLETGRSALAGIGGPNLSRSSSWIHGQEVQVGSQGDGCGLLVHSGLWQQLSNNCGLFVKMVSEIVLPSPTLFPTCKCRNTDLVFLWDDIQVCGKVPAGSKKVPCFFWQDWFSVSIFTDPAKKKTSSQVMGE